MLVSSLSFHYSPVNSLMNRYHICRALASSRIFLHNSSPRNKKTTWPILLLPQLGDYTVPPRDSDGELALNLSQFVDSSTLPSRPIWKHRITPCFTQLLYRGNEHFSLISLCSTISDKERLLPFRVRDWTRNRQNVRDYPSENRGISFHSYLPKHILCQSVTTTGIAPDFLR